MKPRLLAPFEQALTLTDQTYGLVAVAVLRLRRAPSPEVLRQALDLLQSRHPLLRVLITPIRKGFAFEPIDPVRPLRLDLVERQGEDHWRAVAQQQLNTPFGSGEAPLLRCTYLTPRAAGAAADVVWAFHHAIMDAASSTQLLHELLSCCAALEQNEAWQPGDLPEELPPFAELLPPDYRGRRLVRRMIPFGLQQLRQDRRDRKARRAGPPEPVRPPSACHIHTLTLPYAATQSIIKQARRNHLTVNSVLAAALLLAVYRRRHQQKARGLQALIFADLRPSLKPAPAPEQLGCYIAMLRVSVPVSPGDTLWSVARSINAAIYKAGKRGEKLLAAMLSKRLMQHVLRRQNERMATTALSYAGPLKVQDTYGRIEVAGLHGFITTNPLSPVLSASGHLFQGRLTLDFMYMTADMQAEEASALVEEIEQLLRI